MIRMCHTVEDVDLERAVRLKREITARCGHRFVPITTGGADHYPLCPPCHPHLQRRDRAPHWVYRCYDANARLIYVGCSETPVERMRQHRANTWWFPQVERIRYTVFQNRRYALTKEREAIGEENPRWNVRGRQRDRWGVDDYVDCYTAVLRGPLGGASRNIAKLAEECERRFGVDLTNEAGAA